MITINLGPFGRFTMIRERTRDPPRAQSPEFIPTQQVDKVRVNKLNAPPSYSLSRELESIRYTPPSYASPSRSMMLRPRSLGRLPIPEHHYTSSSSSDSPARMPRPSSPAAPPNPSYTYAGISSTSRSRSDASPLTRILTRAAESPWMTSMPNERRTNMQRWLIEVVALMLDADFDALNAALCPDESNAWGQNKTIGGGQNVLNGTVLSVSNQHWLERTARKFNHIQHLVEQNNEPEFMDAWLVFRVFIKPSRTIDPICEDFVMDLLGWYSDYRASSTSQADTFARPWENEEGTPEFLAGLHAAYMRNFEKLIQDISLNANVKAVLENALRNYFRLERLGTAEGRVRYSPVRLKYSGLPKVIEQCQNI